MKKDHNLIIFVSIHRNIEDELKNNLNQIFSHLAQTQNPKEIEAFFASLFTDAELKDLRSRWEILKRLHAGHTQRAIAKDLKLGLCKITRGSKELKKKNALIKTIIENLNE